MQDLPPLLLDTELPRHGEQVTQSLFSPEYGDFKRLVFVQKAYMGGMNLHDLRTFDFGPLVEDHAVDHDEAL